MRTMSEQRGWNLDLDNIQNSDGRSRFSLDLLNQPRLVR